MFSVLSFASHVLNREVADGLAECLDIFSFYQTLFLMAEIAFDRFALLCQMETIGAARTISMFEVEPIGVVAPVKKSLRKPDITCRVATFAEDPSAFQNLDVLSKCRCFHFGVLSDYFTVSFDIEFSCFASGFNHPLTKLSAAPKSFFASSSDILSIARRGSD